MRLLPLPLLLFAILVAVTTFPATEAEAAEARECQGYARGAILQFQIAQRFPKCRVPTSARWQPNYQNHYGWCLTAPRAWLRSEEQARETHLRRCGGRTPI